MSVSSAAPLPRRTTLKADETRELILGAAELRFAATGFYPTRLEDIAEDVKRLLDVCAPGGGYLFDFNGSLENCKPENLEIMFETLDKYGKY